MSKPANNEGDSNQSSEEEQSMNESEQENDGEPSEADDSQVMFFVSDEELMEYTKSIHLRRTKLINLQEKDKLDDDTFAGGNVMVHFFPSSSQSHCDVFIQDESTHDSKHLRVHISGDIINRLPTLTNDHKLYVHNASLEQDSEDFSQDFGKCLVVSGEGVRVWVVHPRARSENFMEKMCGKKWWKKRKRFLRKLEQKKEQRAKEAELRRLKKNLADNGPPSTSSHQAGESSGANQAGGTSSGGKTVSENHSFPDDFDFPDSAFTENQLDHEASSSSSGTSSDSDSNSDSEVDMEWIPKKRKLDHKYEYKKLGDLVAGERKVNVFGVVKEFDRPGPTRGNDYCCVVTLVDESNPLVGTKCVLFNRNKDRLPHIQKEGDILCLHRVNIDEYRCSLQIEGMSYTSCMYFSGDITKKIKPKTASSTFTFLHSDKMRVKELRLWALKAKRNKLSCKLEAVTPGLRFNLLCQVVSIAEYDHCTVLSVWDGTVLPLRAKTVMSATPECDITEDEGLVATAYGFTQQVVIYDKKLVKHVKLVPGCFVFLYGVHASVVEDGGVGEVELCVRRPIVTYDTSLPECKVEVIERNDYAFRDLEEQFEQCSVSQDAVTTTPHSSTPVFSLREVMDKSIANGPLKFRCKVKVIGMITASLEEMVRLRCPQCDVILPISTDMDINVTGTSNVPCQQCSDCGQTLPESPNPFCMYFFKMQISDSTASVEVCVKDNQALRLLSGVQPTNFYRHPKARYKLVEKLYRLTGGNPPFNCRVTKQPRPWMECCVVKVQLPSGREVLCLFDTEHKQ